MHRNSLLLFEKYALPFFKGVNKVLEVGPDTFPSGYQVLINEPEVEWHTLDLYEHEKLTYTTKDEYNFPIEDSTYDVVVSGQVIEHVKKIWHWVRELDRVCRPGGKLVLISPISWPFHEHPVDCWRIYPDGMKALLEETRFRVVFCHVDSLENPEYKRKVYGRSEQYMSKIRRRINRLLGLNGFPAESPLDMITIAEKLR